MKLVDWLRGLDCDPPRPRMTNVEFARRIGGSESLVTQYCDGSVWPGREKMNLIVQVTRGAVTANDFLQAAE